MKMWKWLSKNDGKSKYAHFESEFEKDTANLIDDCACCKFYRCGSNTCNVCPLNVHTLCQIGEHNSAYDLWECCGHNSKYAEIIYKALKKYWNKKFKKEKKR